MGQIIFGVWPLAGITSAPVSPDEARQTIRAAIDAGITDFDTAYSYGYDGEAERFLGDALHERRPEIGEGPELRVIGKVGSRWKDGRRYFDGSPEQLTLDAEESLRRLRLQKFDCLMLHAVDPAVDLRRSAEALEQLRRRGLADTLGICNVNADQLRTFAAHVPCTAIQCPLNLLQRDSLGLIETAAGLGIRAWVYWVLMKGLLAGRISRDHAFAAGDSRPKYEIFQGESRDRAHDVIDRLAAIARRHGTTVARLTIGWVLAQPGVSAALVGAKSPQQIRETADAAALTAELLAEVESAAGAE